MNAIQEAARSLLRVMQATTLTPEQARMLGTVKKLAGIETNRERSEARITVLRVRGEKALRALSSTFFLVSAVDLHDGTHRIIVAAGRRSLDTAIEAMGLSQEVEIIE